MSFAELVVDNIEPEEDDAMYLRPSKLNTSVYLASNIFDQATIRNCPVEKITSGGLAGIFSSLKPLAKINITVFQPIAVMVFYDSKQIEANLKLAGFENIEISDVNIKDQKTGQTIQTQSIEAQKPESKRNSDIVVEVRKTAYKESKPSKYETKNDRYNITTKTTTRTETSEYKPRGNKTYVKSQVKEEVIPSEGYSRKRYGEEKPKNRTYVKEEETTTEGKGGRFTRRYKVTTKTES
jgi:hypothetical protein